MNMNSGDRGDSVPPVNEPVAFDVRHLSEQQLAALGVSHIAYVKPVIVTELSVSRSMPLTERRWLLPATGMSLSPRSCSMRCIRFQFTDLTDTLRG